MARAAAKSRRPDEPRMVHVRLDPELHRRLRIVVAAGLVMLMLELAIKTFGKAETSERQASDLNVG